MRNGYLVAIAVFRLLKAAILVAAGLGALRMLRPEVAERVREWVAAMPFAAEHEFVRRALGIVTTLSPHRVELIAAVAFAYAALFIVEGTGLLTQRRWAEWLTIIATTSFIPFEVVECVRRATLFRGGVIAANVAIVIYLVARRVKKKRPAISGLAGPFSIR